MGLSKFSEYAKYAPAMPDFNLAANLGQVAEKRRSDDANILGKLSAFSLRATPGTGDAVDADNYTNKEITPVIQELTNQYLAGKLKPHELQIKAAQLSQKISSSPDVKRWAYYADLNEKMYPTALSSSIEKGNYRRELDPFANPWQAKNWRSNQDSPSSLFDFQHPDEKSLDDKVWGDLMKDPTVASPDGTLRSGVTEEFIGGKLDDMVETYKRSPEVMKLWKIETNGQPYDPSMSPEDNDSRYEDFVRRKFRGYAVPRMGTKEIKDPNTSGRSKGNGQYFYDVDATQLGEINVASEMLGHKANYWDEVQKYSNAYTGAKSKEEQDVAKVAVDELRKHGNEFGQSYIKTNNLSTIPMDGDSQITAAEVVTYIASGHQDIGNIKDKISPELMLLLRGRAFQSKEIMSREGVAEGYNRIALTEEDQQKVLDGDFDQKLAHQYMEELANKEVTGFDPYDFKKKLNTTYTEKYVGAADFNSPVYSFDRINEKTGKPDPIIVQEKIAGALDDNLDISMLTNWNVRPLGTVGQKPEDKEKEALEHKKPYKVAKEILDNIKAGKGEDKTPVSFGGFFYSPVKGQDGWWFKFNVGGKEYAGTYRGLTGQIMKEVSNVYPRFTEIVGMAADVPGGSTLPNALLGKYKMTVMKNPDTGRYTASYVIPNPKTGTETEQRLGEYDNKAQMIEDLWNLNDDLAKMQGNLRPPLGE